MQPCFLKHYIYTILKVEVLMERFFKDYLNKSNFWRAVFELDSQHPAACEEPLTWATQYLDCQGHLQELKQEKIMSL